MLPPADMQAIPALSSLSLSVNWAANFLVAILFLPLRDFLSSLVDPNDPYSATKGEGRIFWVFMVINVLSAGVVWRGLKG